MDIEVLGLIGAAGTGLAAIGMMLRSKKAQLQTVNIPEVHAKSRITEPHDHIAGSCDYSGWYCDYTTVDGDICGLHKHVPELPLNGEPGKVCRCGAEVSAKAWA